MTNSIEQTKEFSEGKDKYCPRCYFENEKKILRTECPHGASDLIAQRVLCEYPISHEDISALYVCVHCKRDRVQDGERLCPVRLQGLLTDIRTETVREIINEIEVMGSEADLVSYLSTKYGLTKGLTKET